MRAISPPGRKCECIYTRGKSGCCRSSRLWEDMAGRFMGSATTLVLACCFPECKRRGRRGAMRAIVCQTRRGLVYSATTCTARHQMHYKKTTAMTWTKYSLKGDICMPNWG
ncbi:hypothetical protein BDN71DRAFT_143428 [Pleurotus eryngii]|uniref:Uncharacterized protein n=1 Tax=Pleurotus eryngii TaxID=5323 RepID=A0A9P5ZQJ9_PLEER|nr:hypothetical protein BDN71DRAFT_143428 [Pleurotus eryngii]